MFRFAGFDYVGRELAERPLGGQQLGAGEEGAGARLVSLDVGQLVAIMAWKGWHMAESATAVRRRAVEDEEHLGSRVWKERPSPSHTAAVQRSSP